MNTRFNNLKHEYYFRQGTRLWMQLWTWKNPKELQVSVCHITSQPGNKKKDLISEKLLAGNINWSYITAASLSYSKHP